MLLEIRASELPENFEMLKFINGALSQILY